MSGHQRLPAPQKHGRMLTAEVSRVVYYSLYNGGPSTLTWSLMAVFLGATAQAASLAEMSSILPIAGAQYRTSLPPHDSQSIMRGDGVRF